MSVRLNFGEQTTSRYGSNFDDTGCEAEPSCLACPLPQCRYDDPRWYNRLVRQRRDTALVAEAERLMVEGITVNQAAETAAEQAGVTVRTVFRAAERLRWEARHGSTLC